MQDLFNKLVDSEEQLVFTKRLPVISPVNGKVMPLDCYPSLLYQQRLFGEGVVVELSGYQVLAPFDCFIEQLNPTAEQIRLRSIQGLRMQIQLGVRPEIMMGDGFKLHCHRGDKIKRGQLILEYDLAKMRNSLSETKAAITLLNSDKLKGVKANYLQMRANEDVLMNIYV